MAALNRSLGLAALGWWLAARGLSEPIEESFTRLETTGVQRLGKSSRTAALVATRRLARALREVPADSTGQPELFAGQASSPSWVDRLETLLNTPRVGLRLEKALIGDHEDFAALIEVELAEDRSVMLAARLAEWFQTQVGGDDEPSALADFLAHGWPIAEGADRHVTFLQEFLANFVAELSDAPAEITQPLGEPDEFRAWLELEARSQRYSESAFHPPASPEPTPEPEQEALSGGEEWAEQRGEEPSVLTDAPETVPAVSATVAATATAESSPMPTSSPEPVTPPLRSSVVPQAEEPARGSGFGFWAFLFQLGWVAALILGWRYFQEHRVKVSPQAISRAATSPAAASPASQTASPTPTGTVARVETPAPATPALEPAIPPLPQKPELSLMPDELGSQAMTLAAAGHHAEAVAVFRRIAQLQSQDKSTGRLPRALVFARMAASLAALERWDEADAVVERSQALLEELLPAQDPDTALGLEMVADYWASRERWPLAARLYQKAVQTYEGTKAENSEEQLSAVNRLAGALRQIGDVKRAETLYRQLVKAYEGAGNVVALDAASAAHNLGNVLLTTDRAGEARGYYEQALAWLAKAPPSDGQAERMAAIMSANYERCLLAMGLSAEEARAKARKPLPRANP